jgi:hypothetical protein
LKSLLAQAIWRRPQITTPPADSSLRQAHWGVLERASTNARSPSAFASALEIAQETTMDFLAELWEFIRMRRKFWLIPLLLLMLVFGGLVVVTKGSALAPFIYTIF